MIATLECGAWRAEIAAHGAQLQGLWDLRTGDQLLWQGDPAHWSGRSPLLFPVVGRLRSDSYLVNGEVYSLPKHGFARHEEFITELVSPRRARFTLTDSPRLRRIYPFPFRLTLTYTLSDEGLRVSCEVFNSGGGTLPFSIGAHPGFFCSPGDYLAFDEPETALAHRLDAQKLLTPADTKVFDGSRRRILLTDGLFDRGALILEKPRSKAVTLVRPLMGRRIRLGFSAPPPCLGLWAFPNAPYVCVEPWHGLDDTPGPVRELTAKPYIQTLAPAGTFRWAMTISSS